MVVAVSIALLAAPLLVLAHGQAPPWLPGSQQVFGATGALQTYTVPGGATAVFIVAIGASGGIVDREGTAFDFQGGKGARVSAVVPVAGGTTLNVVVGRAGGNSVNPEGSANGAGGAGGSFVFRTTGTILVAAGGGGGAGVSDHGHDAFIAADGHGGSADPPDGGTGGTGGYGGGASTASGLSAGNSGGGGSFVAAGGTVIERSILSTTGDGSVTICAVAAAEPIPALGGAGMALVGLLLALAGIVAPRLRAAA